MIITFYSFKGGVGRTLALANVGVVLAQNGHRVLVVDFDLEAPGLTRYFENKFGSDLQYKRGLLELLERQRDVGDGTDHLQRYTVEIVRSTKGGVLDLLTSGYQDKSYPKRILDFDWSEFFMDDDGGSFFEHCREEWTRRYDYVLIDSRTGITDSGGVCTIQLPDIVVPVFTASQQSVDGVIDIMRRVQEGRQLLAYDRAPAAIVPLPSRFDSRTEYALSQQWLDRFAVQFKEFYKSWLPKEIPVKQVLERTKLPYVAFFSFGERLPVFEESGSDPESLSYALRTFSRLLESSLQDASSLVANSGSATDHGETVTRTGPEDLSIGDIRDAVATTGDGSVTAAPVPPSTLSPPSQLSETGNPQGPIFFLSYAQARQIRSQAGPHDVNRFVVRLFDDLSMHVDQLVGSPTGGARGFMDRSMESGTRWVREVLAAAGTCHVFIPLISSGYVKSEWCAMEWDAFSRRKVVRRPSGSSGNKTSILPVIWSPMLEDQLPPAMRKLQFFLPQKLTDPDITQRYLTEGVYGLLALHDEATYQAVVWRLARSIVDAYHAYHVEPNIPTDSRQLRGDSWSDDG